MIVDHLLTAVAGQFANPQVSITGFEVKRKAGLEQSCNLLVRRADASIYSLNKSLGHEYVRS